MDIITRNNVRTFGQGTQSMVFAHGFGCDQTMWRYITPEFERDFHIILFDYVGCGASDRNAYDPKRYSSLDGYVQDLLDVCAALQLEDVVFVGHSVSSMIGMLAAQQEPDLFRRMIMLGPSACYVNEPGYEGGFERDELEAIVESIGYGDAWAEKMAATLMGDPVRPENTAELVAKFCELDPGIARQLARVSFLYDCRPWLPAHQVPTLLVQTTNDQVVPVSAAEYVRRYMQKSTLIHVAAEGHFPHISAPAATARSMWGYLFSSWQDSGEVK
jgi:sigma-B regulation protein RsbQ